jgi:hypothetical protein
MWPTSDALGGTPHPTSGPTRTRNSGARWSERPTCPCARTPSGDGCTGPWICRVPGRPAMTDRRPRDGTTATTYSHGTASRSPSSGGRSGRASGSRHCSAGVARAGRSSRCLRRRQGRTGDDPQLKLGWGRHLRCFLACSILLRSFPSAPLGDQGVRKRTSCCWSYVAGIVEFLRVDPQPSVRLVRSSRGVLPPLP